MKSGIFPWRIGWILLTGLATSLAMELPPLERVDVPTPAYGRLLEMEAQVDELRERGHTAGLEKLAASLRESEVSLDGGTWFLSHFYGSVVSIPKEEPAAGEAMKFYEEWAKARPESITAQVCLAKALTTYAWRARGTGWSNTVTEEGWRLMAERLERAWQVLDDCKSLEGGCPGWYGAAQKVALGQGWDRETYFASVDEALSRYPTYGRFVTNTCYWLLPRWFGEEGDFEAWIKELATKYPEGEQDRQYARLVWMADNMSVSGEMVFAPGRLDWEKTKAGFNQWVDEIPDNLMVRFEFIRLALLAGDRAAVRSQFDVTGGKYFPRIWKNEAQFEAARQFAYGQGDNPLEVVKSAEPSRQRVTPEVLHIVETTLRVLGGFIGGVLVGLALLLLGWQRRETTAGVLAALVCLLVGALLGTLATLLPAGFFYLFLKRKNLVHPPELAPQPGWLVLIWVLVLAVVPLILQVGAVVLAVIPAGMQYGASAGEMATDALIQNGMIFRQFVASQWIGLLLLLIVCQPQNWEGWQRRLGLYSCRWLPALGWSIGLGLVFTGLGLFLDQVADNRTREALETLAGGMDSPFWCILAVAVAAPVMEELIFRGYAFSGWVGKLGVWGAILLPALIFTAIHIQYGWSGLIYVFLIGLALGVVRWKTGSIYPCIALHMANNLLSCLQMAFDPF